MVNGPTGPATRVGRFVQPGVWVTSMQPDQLYYRRRRAEEAAAATAAMDPKVGAVHLELARQYDQCIEELDRAGEDTRSISAA